LPAIAPKALWFDWHEHLEGALKRQRVKGWRAWFLSWGWVALGVIGTLIVATAIVWWPLTGEKVAAGTPRLVVDHTALDLGRLAFDQPAVAVFTLTNSGDGVLKIVEPPRVRAVKGC
jgi:hypothetical protein